MTETAPVTVLCSRHTPLQKRGSVGQLLPGTRARIADLTTGEDLGPGQRGELLIKGPQVRVRGTRWLSPDQRHLGCYEAS